MDATEDLDDDRNHGVPFAQCRVVRAWDHAIGAGGGRLAENVVVEAIGGVAEGDGPPERAGAGVVRGAGVDYLRANKNGGYILPLQLLHQLVGLVGWLVGDPDGKRCT